MTMNYQSATRPIKDDTLKWLAIATMLIDHIGFLLLPQFQILRIIGRLSFPIFAYFIAKGYKRTKSVKSYALRLAFFACLSQIPYALFVGEAIPALGRPNIFFTLLLGLLALPLIHHKQLIIRMAVVPLALFAESFHLSYGAYGLFMILFFSLWENQKVNLLISMVFINVMYWVQNPTSPQPLAILALPVIWYLPALKIKCPKWLAYSFYPIHLLILVALSYWFY